MEMTVARLVKDLNHPSSNLAVGMSEECFIGHFASVPLEVALKNKASMGITQGVVKCDTS